MSSTALIPPPTPQTSRVALVAYLVCGAVGALGMFAAATDVRGALDDDSNVFIDAAVAVPLPVDPLAPAAVVDARALIGVWRSGSDHVVLDATGALTSCIRGVTAHHDWTLNGSDIVVAGVDQARVVFAEVSADNSGVVVVVDSQAFHAVEGPVSPVAIVGGDL